VPRLAQAPFSFTAPVPRADFILWGKLLPPEALGPRCYDHAEKWVPGVSGRADQYAVFDLRPVRRRYEAIADLLEREATWAEEHQPTPEGFGYPEDSACLRIARSFLQGGA
jgi:hypothetical protein